MTSRVTSLLRIVTCCMLPLAAAQACGPDFYHDVFVRSAQPDLPKQFVQGRLGLLQTGFGRGYDLVAYRYLNGGTFDAAEQKNWSPNLSLTEQANAEQDAPGTDAFNNPTPDDPAADWVKLRSQYPDAPAGEVDRNGTTKVKTIGGAEYEQFYLNCAMDAFRVAATTLQARSSAWGRSSPAMQDWLRAQDVVFSDCGGGDQHPAPAPANSPALLVQDRAYQVSAAKFYGGDLAGAATGFAAISKDTGSPWQPSAGYLVGRALIRQAFFAKPATGDHTEYDPARMQAAQRQRQGYLASHPPQRWHAAAGAQLNLVRLRTEPEQRLHELAALVGGPGHDSNYQQDAMDLLWIISNGTPDGLREQPEPGQILADPAHPGQTRTLSPQEAEAAADATRDAAWNGSKAVRSQADMVDWTLTLQSLSASAPGHALEQWRLKRSTPWLVAALMRSGDQAAAPDDLLRAAAAVSPDSPAWQTVTYHRVRLLLGAHRVAEARSALSDFDARLQAVPAEQREPSTVNAMRGLGMLAAATLPQFLSEAPRTLLVAESEEASAVSECLEVMKNPKRHYDCVEHVAPDQLDTDAAAALNAHAPLSVWLKAAGSADLSPQLRTAVAVEGWTRAVLLKNSEAAKAFLPLVPTAVRTQAEGSSPLAAWMTLARNPGLSPYLNGGTQRSYSYDFVESYRDNWCYRPTGSTAYGLETPPAQLLASPAFLTAAEEHQGAAEAARLDPMRSLDVGQQIVQAVRANPKDSQAAEALYLVLRMIRYGCTEPAPEKPESWQTSLTYSQEAKGLLQLKQDAGRLLRKYYATSPWTAKAAPFVG